jgi:hypothetical protein
MNYNAFRSRVTNEENNTKYAKEKLLKEALDPNNFPEITTTKNKSIKKTQNTNEPNEPNENNEEIKIKSTFLDKLKTENHIEDRNSNDILPGWVEIIRNPNTNRAYIRDNLTSNKTNSMNNTRKNNNNIFCTEHDLIYKVIDKVVENYEKRQKDSMELLGEYEYNRLFLFPNYEYFYNDRLDQEYEDELERQMEEQEKQYMQSNVEDYYEYNEYY